MPEAVSSEVLTAEPPCNHDDVIPQSLPFEHSKNDNASSGLAIIALDRLFATDEAPRTMRGLSEFLVALELGQKDTGLVAGAAYAPGDGLFRTTISDDVFENDHATRSTCLPCDRWRAG